MAGEYDGIQHDEDDPDKNPFCDTEIDIIKMKARDNAKNEVAFNKKVILIRLKAIEGFNKWKLLNKQREVLKELIWQFNSQVINLFGYTNVRLKYDPFLILDPLETKESNRLNGPIDDFI